MFKAIARNGAVRGVMIAMALAVPLGTATAAERPDVHLAEARVAETTQAGLAALEQYPEDTPARRRHFLSIAEAHFDLDMIAKLALGGHRRKITTDQMVRFKPLFEAFLARKYSALLGGQSGDGVEIMEVTESGSRDLLVHTFVEAGNDKFRVAWRVRNSDGAPRIIDVQVENISLVIALREELDSVIRREGIDGLIDRLSAMAEDVGVQQAAASEASL